MNKKYIYLIATILTFLLIFFASKITYTIDELLVHEFHKKPIFVVKKAVYEDIGAIEYIGLGYQIIEWDRYSDRGIRLGYEVRRFPDYWDINEGAPGNAVDIPN